MNEIPKPCVKERCVDTMLKKELRAKEGLERFVHSGSLLNLLSDPLHSLDSERMDRSGTGCCLKRTPSISNRLKLTDHHVVGPSDFHNNASLIEISDTKIETRSRAQTPASSTTGVMTHLKDVSNALTTSKELLEIINRICYREDCPSSSLYLISALHTELERARMQINQLIQEQRLDQNEISYVIKCFAEEKEAWKSKEQEIVEVAIESVAVELDVERKLRKQFERLNKRLGRELAETKASLLKKVKELESEKRAREIVEQVYDELARDAKEDKYEIENIKRESTKVYEVAEKDKEMMQLADILREERDQMELSEKIYQLEEKNAAVNELRNQLETLLGNKKVREKGCSTNNLNSQEIAAYFGRTRFVSLLNEDKEYDGEVDNEVECEDESPKSDLHSAELNTDDNDDDNNNTNKNYKWANPSESRFNMRRYPVEEEHKGGRSTSGRVSRRSASLQRSESDGIKCRTKVEKIQNSKVGLDLESFCELEKQAHGKGYGDEKQGYKIVKGKKDKILAGSKLVSSIVYDSPTRQYSQPKTSYLSNTFQENPAIGNNGIKSRLVDMRGEGHNVRKYK